MTDLPHYIDDPLVDRSQHKLHLDLDPVASALAGRDLVGGTCSCGGMETPAWDDYAVLDRFEDHMADVQLAVRRVLEDG